MIATAQVTPPEKPVTPRLPKPGEYITLYQMTGIVVDIVPESDYYWNITVRWNMADDNKMHGTFLIPTDTLTS